MSNVEENIRRLNAGKLSSRLLEVLESEFAEREEGIINSVVSKLNTGETIDPQFALQKWLELYAMRKLKRSLRQKERSGASAAVKLKTDLT